MTSFFLPDINVWLALAYDGHGHHTQASIWYATLDSGSRLCFCRHTQIGFMRLMNHPSILGRDARTQLECWSIFYDWIASGRAVFLNEPAAIDERFSELTSEKSLSPNRWADMYLAAFAETAGIPLVTFDKALATKTSVSILLQ